jgi:hypothetical protein
MAGRLRKLPKLSKGLFVFQQLKDFGKGDVGQRGDKMFDCESTGILCA